MAMMEPPVKGTLEPSEKQIEEARNALSGPYQGSPGSRPVPVAHSPLVPDAVRARSLATGHRQSVKTRTSPSPAVRTGPTLEQKLESKRAEALAANAEAMAAAAALLHPRSEGVSAEEIYRAWVPQTAGAPATSETGCEGMRQPVAAPSGPLGLAPEHPTARLLSGQRAMVLEDDDDEEEFGGEMRPAGDAG